MLIYKVNIQQHYMPLLGTRQKHESVTSPDFAVPQAIVVTGIVG